jgi:hypothetical protein
MVSSTILVSAAIAVLGLSSAEASDQAHRVPVGIRLTLNSAEARMGARVPVVVALKNFKGESVPTTERMAVTLESSLQAKVEPVVIPAGKDSVTATVIFERAGIAKLKASSGKLSPGYAVISITRARAQGLALETGIRLASFGEPSTQAPGLKLGLKALATKLVPRNRVWSTTVLVAVLNQQGEGVRVSDDLPVRLASTLGTIEPDSLIIAKGESAAFVNVTSKTPGFDTITALSPAIDERAEERIEYEQGRPSKLLIISTPSQVVTNGRTSASITVLLRDDDDHVVAVPDRDTRVVLRTTFGTLSAGSTSVARGRPDSEPIVLESPRAGRATITAIAEGFREDSEEVSFVLPFLLIGLASAGGVGGALLRAPRNRRRTQIGASLAVGAFLGAIFFALGMMGVPGMIPAIPVATLERLTLNEVGACLLGVFGGYAGRRFLDDLLVRRGGSTRTGVATA